MALPAIITLVTNPILLFLTLLFLTVTVVLLISLSNIFFTEGNTKPRHKLPPSPPKLPIIGNLHQLGHLPHRSFSDLSKKHGPLMFLKLGTVPTIVASSAASAKEILKTHDLDCCSRPFLTSPAKLSYNCSDLASAPYGATWRRLRKICIIEFFSSKRVLLFQPIREEEIGRMIRTITLLEQSRTSIDLSAMLLSLANDITCRAALGKRYYEAQGSRLHEILGETQEVLGGFFFADYIPWLGWVDSTVFGMQARLQKNFSDLDTFIENVIVEHMDPERAGESADTVDALLRSCKDQTNEMTRDNIKAVIENIFIGGTDTTATAVEWAMAELMRNPKAMKKAQDEVRGLIGTKGKVEESDLPHFPYLKCIVKEVMRLHPPIPLLVQRETMNHFKIDNFDIPAKTRLIINAWAIGRDESSWEKPEEFRPERFMDNSIDLKGHDFQLVPFGGGRRICPAMHVALVVLEVTLANLLYSFNWELPKGMSVEDIDMEEAVGITVHKKSPLHVVATKYEDGGL